ncbi:hypothetical protein Afil01_50800 [Actinorhabdospora filicis]|uniref:DNA polymerase III subunit gamma/tau n=1 Tax=Actinorhabdospora filicis TaxID=1785913 RepID=A0A9W6WBP0_9ACTN|nr:DNA polymerase III subunit gamma and tau [Actinorhabdospora filicis]GLZ80273.1 hypothetical protein Afil01_50800 [Actinorhabdospora filicis]
MALALYRKYRPQSFGEVIGQEHVTEPLMQALRNNRLNHAYLFSGPRGCGKTTSARILARSVNCAKGPTPEPCGECDSCVALGPNGSGAVDVIEIDAASHGGVDDARELRERAVFAPVQSKYKVYVIDEAHMVSSAGFNALLKLVEEPPSYVMFIFATTEPDKVLPTIKSRTHHYPFRLIPPATMRGYAEELVVREGVQVEPSVYPLVVRAGGGSARDTLSVLDQLIAGAGPEGVTYQRAIGLLGVTDITLIDEMCDALAAADGAGAMQVIDRVVEAGHDPRRFAQDLLERLRDLIVLNQVPDAGSSGLIDVPSDQLERMTGQALRLGPASLTRMAEIVHEGLLQMRGTTASRLILELVCAKALLPAVDDSSGALLQRLEQMERRVADGVIAAPGAGYAPVAETAPMPAAAPVAAPGQSARDAAMAAAAAATKPTPAAPAPAPPVAAPAETPAPPAPAPVAPAPTPPSTSAAASSWDTPAAPPAPAAAAAPGASSGRPDAAAIRRSWDSIKDAVKRRKRTVGAYLMEASVRDVEGDTVILSFKHAFHATAMGNGPSQQIFIEALTEVLGGSWKVRCETGGGPPAPARAAAPPPPPPVAAPTPPVPSQHTAPTPPPAASAPPPRPAPVHDEPPWPDEEPPPEDMDEFGGARPGDVDVTPVGTAAERAERLLKSEFGAETMRD